MFEQDIAAAEKVASDAREFFCTLAQGLCAGLDAADVWTIFQAELLTPLLEEAGANAYRLITGDELLADASLVTRFLKGIDPAFHPGLRELVTTFLDPKKEEVRAHVSRMLHARFCVEASGLPEDAIQKLNATIGRKVKFRVFVDTNFLFSLLELHENPSNAAARELVDLIAQLQSTPEVKLFIVPPTIDEARTSLASTKQRLSGIPTGENFARAASSVGFSGMAQKFLSESLQHGGRLTAEDWFDPYLDNFVAVARGKGIEVFNDRLGSYSQRQDVVDDIHNVLEFEKRLDGNRRKTYQSVAHDMILWHFVTDKRPVYIESPIDARDWILTVDFRLIGFDAYKRRKAGSRIPLCLHPTSLMQLLQFWVPRSKEFEEAMLGSLRLPFLFQEFDVESERISLRILKGLGRFEKRDDLSEDTITSVILNDGLRSRLRSERVESEEAEIALIRDTLVEEMKARAAAETSRAQKLQAAVDQKEAALSERDARERLKDEEVRKLSARVAEEECRTRVADERLATQGVEVARLRVALERLEESKKHRSALVSYFGLLALVSLVAGAAAWQVDRLFPDWARMFGAMPIKSLAAIVVLVAGHLLLEWASGGNERMKQLWLFGQVRRFRVKLWVFVVIGIVVAVGSNLYANWIQKQIDRESGASSSSRSGSSSSPVTDSEETSGRK